MAVGFVLAYVNAFLLGSGANVCGPGTLMTGIFVIAAVLPVFWYRHYFVDKGQFPERMRIDLHADHGRLNETKAGIKPWLALGAGLVIVVIANQIFHI